MKADKKAIFAGASKASEAAGYLAALQSGCVSILHILLSFWEAYFLANLRGLPVSCPKRFAAETVARAISAATVMKISPAPFRG
jgi:hypothetical protein